MQLELRRRWFTDESTIGELFVNGVRECYILEDKVREVSGKPVSDWKIKSKTAIPYGKYQVIINFSNRFQQDMPLLLAVPGFEGVRIHWGNTAHDTEGCPLVGETRGDNWVGTSRKAFARFFPKLQEAISNGEPVTIDVTKGAA